MEHRGACTLLLFVGVLILFSVSTTATCTFDKTDTWPCQPASPDGHTYGGSAGPNAELRYRLVDCNTGMVYGSGMICSNQVSPAYYPPLGTTVRWIVDIYQCAYCGEGSCVDNDHDGYGNNCALGPDCNDANSAVHPGATEICNGIDDNCNQQIDENNVCQSADPDLQLLEQYSPVLFTHPDERYLPRNIESMLQSASLWKYAFMPNLVASKVKDSPVTATDLDGMNSTYYLDLAQHEVDPIAKAVKFVVPSFIFDVFKNTLIQFGIHKPQVWITDPSMFSGYPTTIYGRVDRRNPSYVALQYWVFYPFNDGQFDPVSSASGVIGFANTLSKYIKELKGISDVTSFSNIFFKLLTLGDTNHEGDWELVQVLLDGNAQPLKISFAEHWYGKTYPWSDVTKFRSTHPMALVAKGDHSMYKGKPSSIAAEFGYETEELDPTGKTLVNEKTVPITTDEAMNLTYLNPNDLAFYNIQKIDDTTNWLRFQGKWGVSAPVVIPSLSSQTVYLTGGPSGPSSQGIRWTDPVSWSVQGEKSFFEQASGIQIDTTQCPRLGSFVFTSLSGCSSTIINVHSPVDLHFYDSSGRHIGLNASGGIDAEIPGTFLYVPSDGDAEILGTFIEGNGTLKVEATDQGTFDLAIQRFNNVSSTQLTANYSKVQIQPTTVATVAITDSIADISMQIDTNGDGVIDKIEMPDQAAASSATGFWHLDENNGTTATDAGPNKLDGQVIGSTSIVQGTFGNARELSGGYILLGDKQELRPENIQVSAWSKTLSGSYQAIFTTGRVQFGSGTTAKQYGIALGISNGKPEVETGTGLSQAIVIQGNRIINDGAWHFIQARYTKAANASFELALFADGELQGAAQGNQSILYATNYKESVIGARKYGSTVDWKFSGTIDEVQVDSITFCNGNCNVTNTTNSTRDATPPTITISEPTGRNYSYTENLTPQFSSADTSGIASMNATLDGISASNGQKITLASLSLGQHIFTVMASDTAGNTAIQNVAFTIIDNVPPVSKAAVQGTLGADGWYTSNVTITLTASDEKSTVQRIEYNLDNTGYVLYTSPIPIQQTSANATHILAFHAIDTVSNVEPQKSVTIKMRPRVVQPRIVAWWPFDENNGTLIYDSGAYKINGQVIGSSKIVTGKYGNARQFSGAGYVLLGDRQELRPENVSIEAWVNTKSTGVMAVFTTGRVQFGSGTTAKQYGIALVLSKGVPSVEVGTGAAAALAAGGTAVISDGNWHLLQAQYGKKAIGNYELSVFIDGKLQGVAQGNGPILYASGYRDSAIAARKYGSTVDWKLIGTIDDVKVRTY